MSENIDIKQNAERERKEKFEGDMLEEISIEFCKNQILKMDFQQSPLMLTHEIFKEQNEIIKSNSKENLHKYVTLAMERIKDVSYSKDYLIGYSISVSIIKKEYSSICQLREVDVLVLNNVKNSDG